ncbi:MAG: FecR domain-containing protein [Bryobacterales bacterium]|nr:FecR domain-containing protein [Bryobacterales bacterium]
MLRAAIRGVFAGLILTAMAGVSPAQIPFFSPAGSQATVVEITGQVSVLRDANSPWVLNQGSTIQPQQMVITGPDGYARFRVSDGSTFEVYPNSKAVFRANPGNLKDLVDMIIGRIRIHIEKLGGQPNPNDVHTPTAVISVRGTIFDVVVDEDETTMVAVTEGLVAVRHALKPSKNERLVGAGEVLRVYRNEPLARNSVDKGLVAEHVFRGLTDALITIMRGGGLRGGGSGAPSGGAPGGGLPGDTKGNPPPPPPPPPAAPPPGNQ